MIRRVLCRAAPVAVAAMLATAPPPAQADAPMSGLVALETGVLGQGWEAVGRIDIGARGFCTGALIEPDLVLTAAHCLYDRDTGARVTDAELRFRAGWRNGRAAAERSVRRSAVHPDYRHGGQVKSATVAHDLALMQLAHPIRQGSIAPFPVQSDPRRGDEVGVVSYARGRSEVPSLEERCRVLQRDPNGVVVLSCSADFGASGAPVFALRDGQLRIVSVISAKAETNGPAGAEAVSLGVSLGPRLEALRRALAAGDTRFIQVGPQQDRDTPRTMSAGGGARFVRP